MATLFVFLLSCKDDKDDPVRPKLVGEFRTPRASSAPSWSSSSRTMRRQNSTKCTIRTVSLIIDKVVRN